MSEQTETSRTTDLRERVIWVVNDAIGASHKYQYLESRTGISARKWKNMCNRVQQPSIEMIAALASEFRPNYLEWMMYGEVLAQRQIDPRDEKDSDGRWVHPELRGEKLQALLKEVDAKDVEELSDAFFALLEKKKKQRAKK